MKWPQQGKQHHPELPEARLVGSGQGAPTHPSPGKEKIKRSPPPGLCSANSRLSPTRGHPQEPACSGEVTLGLQERG